MLVTYQPHWLGLSESSWERGMDPSTLSKPHRLYIVRPARPTSTAKTNRLSRRMRIGAAQSGHFRINGERFLAPGYACVAHVDRLRRYHDTVLPNGVYV